MDELPKTVRNRTMWPIASPRGNDLATAAAQMLAGNREQAPVAELLGDHEGRHVPPAHAFEDDLLLHELIAHRPNARAFDEIVIAPRRMARGVANDALDIIPHLLGCDVSGHRKR